MSIISEVPDALRRSLLDNVALPIHLAEGITLEITVSEVRLLNGPDSNEPVNENTLTLLLHGLLMRELIDRREVPGSHDSDRVALDPEMGVRMLELAYDKGGDVVNAWEVLVTAVGRADAWSLLREKLGDEKFDKVRKTIMGEV
ncbi:hypothetical protein GCM10010149_88480 [Nonomuraea roseoviolacea subsp. roseoviolacea]|uniref:hypothetical protein n=1 Tax=Nonomuraea roseoviolacea TaxID=103837 RepID=UPI0031E08E79